jgi:hypothetical protein
MVGLIVPAAFHWKPALTVVAATVLAIESLIMAFIAYGRMVLKPIV